MILLLESRPGYTKLAAEMLIFLKSPLIFQKFDCKLFAEKYPSYI